MYNRTIQSACDNIIRRKSASLQLRVLSCGIWRSIGLFLSSDVSKVPAVAIVSLPLRCRMQVSLKHQRTYFFTSLHGVASQFKARLVWRQAKWVRGLEFSLFAFMSPSIILVIRNSVVYRLLPFE